jgi:hypothetical protein
MIRTSAHATKTTRNAGMRSQPTLNCARDEDTRWTCEEHPDKPMGHDGCKGAGDPCPDCNPQSADKVPTLPPGFKIERT